MNGTNMQRGDHIRVWSNWQVWHEAIFVSDDEVIEHAKPYEGGKIRRVTLAQFQGDRSGHVVKHQHCFPPDVVVERARSAIGRGRYGVLSQNCEHFARWCKAGRKQSKQVEIASTAMFILLLIAVLAEGNKKA